MVDLCGLWALALPGLPQPGIRLAALPLPGVRPAALPPLRERLRRN